MDIKEEQIELRSEEMQEILGKPPARIIRWASGIISMFIALLIGLSFVIEYPEKIEGTAEITSTLPAVSCISKQTASIKTRFKENGQLVAKNDNIIELDNPADLNQVKQLKQLLALSDSAIVKDTTLLQARVLLQLGMINDVFIQFTIATAQMQSYKFTNTTGIDNSAAQNQITLNNAKRNQLNNMLNNLRKEYDIVKQEYSANENLFRSGVISKQELNVSYQKLMAKESEIASMQNNISSLRADNIRLNQSIHQNSFGDKKSGTDLFLNYTGTKQQLVKAITDWETLYLIKAPVSGTLEFDEIWFENQYVNSGDKVCDVIPEQSKTIARAKVSAYGYGKITEGMKAQLRLENYPFEQFGSLEAIVFRKSNIPDKEGNYLVELELTKGLMSSEHKQLAYTPNMQATAVILLNKKKLYEKFIEKFREVRTK